MRILAAFAAILALSAPAYAGCIPVMSSDGVSITYDQGGARTTIFYADLPGGNNPDTIIKKRAIRDALQSLVDKRFSLLELDIDDPDRTEPQTSPTHYWSDEEGNPRLTLLDGPTHITERCAEVTDVFWNGVDYVVTWVSVD